MEGTGKRFYINDNKKFAVEQGEFRNGSLYKGIHVSKSKIKFADERREEDHFSNEDATSGIFKMWEPNFFTYARFKEDKAHNVNDDL